MTLKIAKVIFPMWTSSVNQYSCVLLIFIWISKEISSIISEIKFLIISFKPDPSSSSSFYSKATQSFTLLRLKFMESSLTSLILLCYILSTMIYCWFSPYWDEPLFNHNELTTSHHFHHHHHDPGSSHMTRSDLFFGLAFFQVSYNICHP